LTFGGRILEIQVVIQRVEISGEMNFVKAMSVAQLCLKHRINKHSKQRIVVFVSSILTATEEELEKLAQKLRRNNVAVNLVNLCEETNQEKLKKVRKFVLLKLEFEVTSSSSRK
jgi:26S proteasome regulatory subunit N10